MRRHFSGFQQQPEGVAAAVRGCVFNGLSALRREIVPPPCPRIA